MDEDQPVVEVNGSRVTQVQFESTIFRNRRRDHAEATTYADVNASVVDDPEVTDGDGDPCPYDGHHVAWAVLAEEWDYLKQSGLSGNEVRKGGRVRIFADGRQVYEFFHPGPSEWGSQGIDVPRPHLGQPARMAWQGGCAGDLPRDPGRDRWNLR